MRQRTYEVVDASTGQGWVYSDIAKGHFFHPRNLCTEESPEGHFDAVGEIGSPACGDIMKMWVKVDKKRGRIKELKWKTFGCGSAIASTSMFSVMVTEKGGMEIGAALNIKPQDIIKRLGGLPARKIHCSLLAHKAFRKTMNAYFRKTGQLERISIEGSRIIDMKLMIYERDIEEAVIEGAHTLEEVQKKLKVGVGSPAILPEVRRLIRLYNKKHYGGQKKNSKKRARCAS